MLCCSIISIAIGILFFVMGFPIWMCGCNTKFSPCIRYNKHKATVVSNQCFITYNDDDRIGGNCNVYVKYKNKEIETECHIYRNDFDDCDDLITSNKQLKKCNNLNLRDYPLNKTVNIYVDKNFDTCYSSHYVAYLGNIGFSFLIVSCIFNILGCLCCCINNIHKKIPHENILYENINIVVDDNQL